ncbi:MAG: PilZ domain-containing protein [Sphingomicrobium sp.]
MRVSLDAEVSLRRPGKSNYRVRVYDASPHGCRVEFVERPTLAERAWIKFDGLEPLEAIICWVKGFATGVQFATPIHPAVFDELMARLKDGRGNLPH